MWTDEPLRQDTSREKKAAQERADARLRLVRQLLQQMSRVLTEASGIECAVTLDDCDMYNETFWVVAGREKGALTPEVAAAIRRVLLNKRIWKRQRAWHELDEDYNVSMRVTSYPARRSKRDMSYVRDNWWLRISLS